MSEEESFSVNRLSEMTGMDRGTIRRRIAKNQVRPARVVNGRKFYRRSDVEKPVRPRLPARDENSPHWLDPIIRETYAAAHHVGGMLREWAAIADLLTAAMAKERTAEADRIEDDLNDVSLAYKKEIGALLIFGPIDDKRRNAERLLAAIDELDPILQSILDIDLTLNVSPFSRCEAGNSLRRAMREPSAEKIKIPMRIGPE